MSQVGAAVKEVRSFVGSADPATLATNEVFKQKSGTLQNKLAGIVKASKMRFDEPWGMVCLYWAAGSPPCYGKVDGGTLKIERGVQPALLAAPHETTDAVPSPISRDAMQPDPR
jgi:hypothetical protein